tara:strand:+ start:217 stop:873 length:657 start_codon:yes stop_codon:yes gene_type:complete
MNQLTFKFPFKTSYYKEDFYVSSNNFKAYKLIESWPKWPGNFLNIYGPKGCGKTHLSKILSKKIKSMYIDAKDFKNELSFNFKNNECMIIDNYNNDIETKLFYTTINQIKQHNKCLVVNTLIPIKKIKVNLSDLKSRFDNFIELGIDLPTDDLLRVIITKFFSDKQVSINAKILEYILKNIDRSYENVFKFIKDLDNESLSSGKSININLIKKVLANK